MINPILIIFGPVGSGKGTQAELLVKNFGIVHISPGDMLRDEVKNNSPEAAVIKKCMEAGELVPFAITDELVRRRLELPDVEKGIIFDGYPRALEQAKTLVGMLQKKGKSVTKVISLKLDFQEILNRLSSRLICLNCRAIYSTKVNPPKVEGVCDKCGSPLTKRADDQEENSIKERMKVYTEETSQVLDYFEKLGIVEEFDASGTIDEIHDKIYLSLSMDFA